MITCIPPATFWITEEIYRYLGIFPCKPEKGEKKLETRVTWRNGPKNYLNSYLGTILHMCTLHMLIDSVLCLALALLN